jgi:hypothetical protein
MYDVLPGTSGQLTVGELLDGRCVIVNVASGEKLVSVNGVDVAENFYHVLSVHNQSKVSVKLTLVTGRQIKQLPAVIK